MLDTRPLRRPAYRRLWIGNTGSVIGTQVTAQAVLLQVYDISHSSLRVGLVGLFALVGLVGFGLYGGAVADAVDRRTLSLCCLAGLSMLTSLLLVQSLLGLRSLPLLYGIVLGQSALFSLSAPARQAMVPRLVGADELPAANALSMLTMNIGFTLGPLLAGVLVATRGGFPLAYAVDLATFVGSVYAAWRLPPLPPVGGGRRAGVASVVEGFRYLGTRPVVLMSFVVDIVAMVFGMPRALFPALAAQSYGGGPATVGALTAAIAVGGLVPSLLSGALHRVRRHGLAVVVAIVAWGLSITAFGLSHALWFGLLMLACAGASDAVSAVYRSTILQQAAPDDMRGRLGGVFTVVVAGGPRLGDVESGGVAALAGVRASAVSGGVACVVLVLALAALVPSFVRYDAGTDASPGEAQPLPDDVERATPD